MVTMVVDCRTEMSIARRLQSGGLSVSPQSRRHHRAATSIRTCASVLSRQHSAMARSIMKEARENEFMSDWIYVRVAESMNNDARAHKWFDKLWSMFALVNALLISSSMQPFVLPPESGRFPFDQPTYCLWALCLIINTLSLLFSLLLYGYLMAVPTSADATVVLRFNPEEPVVRTLKEVIPRITLTRPARKHLIPCLRELSSHHLQPAAMQQAKAAKTLIEQALDACVDNIGEKHHSKDLLDSITELLQLLQPTVAPAPAPSPASLLSEAGKILEQLKAVLDARLASGPGNAANLVPPPDPVLVRAFLYGLYEEQKKLLNHIADEELTAREAGSSYNVDSYTKDCLWVSAAAAAAAAAVHMEHAPRYTLHFLQIQGFSVHVPMIGTVLGAFVFVCAVLLQVGLNSPVSVDEDFGRRFFGGLVGVTGTIVLVAILTVVLPSLRLLL